MKKTALLSLLAAATLFSAFTAGTTTDSTAAATEAVLPAKGTPYTVELDKSELKWRASKVVGEHYGTIKLSSGQMTVDKNKVTGGSFVMNMASIECTDNAKVGAHLRNDDFFSVEKHPTATFVIKSLKPVAKAEAGKPNYTVEGDLTIKGITNPISFPAIVTVKDGIATAKADVTVNRVKYDIRYRSSSFFENLGDKAINDDFTVSLDVTAKQSNI
ncbi:YceI family protein [Pontibacter sp. SGAir0037]|uniref:YceI family protein n=1 Tax=Pontibacter sp. SGAir0037 TaxID=2571030 RepID=UPI0010CCC827|nr:YceI family protein [Pontibacter sp. SGAir0037]QCR23235.1 lipid-binding protein [Pontibacter sp. SGAir0037]